MKLVLVRHGETEWNKVGRFQGHDGVGLNARGMAQAKETARSVAALKHSAVYTSPLLRALQTAEEISKVCGKPVVPVEGLAELRLGDLEGITGEEMRAKWPELHATWRSDPSAVVMPNGECLAELQERAWNALVHLEKASPDDEALIVVSHNFAIRAMIGKLLGMALSNFHAMSLSLASICIVESDQRGRRLVAYNSTCHLSVENR